MSKPLKRRVKVCRQCPHYISMHTVRTIGLYRKCVRRKICRVSWHYNAEENMVSDREFVVPKECPYRLETMMFDDGKKR